MALGRLSRGGRAAQSGAARGCGPLLVRASLSHSHGVLRCAASARETHVRCSDWYRRLGSNLKAGSLLALRPAGWLLPRAAAPGNKGVAVWQCLYGYAFVARTRRGLARLDVACTGRGVKPAGDPRRCWSQDDASRQQRPICIGIAAQIGLYWPDTSRRLTIADRKKRKG